MRRATSWAAALMICGLIGRAEAGAVCVGDCNGDGMVAINELILGVNIAQGSTPLSECPSFDADGSGTVGINELITAVNNALNGCPAGCVGTERVFTVEPGVFGVPPGPVTNDETTRTGLFTTGIGGINAALSFSPGPLTLVMGTPDANGVACLALKEDVTISITIVDSSCLCMKFMAADGAGSIDCDGGTPYDVEARRANMAPTLAWDVTTGLGEPAGPGNANLLVMGLFERTALMNCEEADCPNHVYSDPPNLFAFTTTTAKSVQETANPLMPNELTVGPSEAFSCANFSTPASGGMLAAPAPSTMDPIGDVSNVFRFAEVAP